MASVFYGIFCAVLGGTFFKKIIENQGYEGQWVE
jgi:hypothetical protein